MNDTLIIFTADAFTSRPFHGNPAAVCVTSSPIDLTRMQQIAFEMNLSETAFIVPLHDSTIVNASSFSLRWFTPKQEVRLCGHATLASAHILFSEYQYPREKIEFHTKSGLLQVRRENSIYIMDFPQNSLESCDFPVSILQALRIPIESVIYCGFSQTTHDLLVEIDSPILLSSLTPDFAHLGEITTPHGIEGVIITSKASSESSYDFTSRFFSPWLGINEDPVTGSAHTVLGPYWASKLGKNQLSAYQDSKRGGFLRLDLPDQKRILISGNALTILAAKLRLQSTITDEQLLKHK
jgi:PhzF family phenazine biosynthesis protein